jgi:hypothetical protein
VTLKELLCSAANRPKVIHDAAHLVDEEVNAKSGISGIAVKTAYKTVKAVKPGLIPDVIDGLLDRFIEQLEPFYTEWSSGAKSQPFDAFLNGQKNKVANALLRVTDDRANHVHNATLRKSYLALRPQGEKNVEVAVPGLGRLLARYVSEKSEK